MHSLQLTSHFLEGDLWGLAPCPVPTSYPPPSSLPGKRGPSENNKEIRAGIGPTSHQKNEMFPCFPSNIVFNSGQTHYLKAVTERESAGLLLQCSQDCGSKRPSLLVLPHRAPEVPPSVWHFFHPLTPSTHTLLTHLSIHLSIHSTFIH